LKLLDYFKEDKSLNSLISTLKQNKHIVNLFVANVLSQAIPVLISPLLTRIYSPKEFGVYALFSSLINIFTVILTMRFENVFFIKKTFSKAKKSLVLFTGLSTTIFTGIILFVATISFIFNFENEIVIVLAIIASLLKAFSTYLLTYMNRLGLYKLMSYYKVSKVIVLVISQVFLGYIVFKYNGLVVSWIISFFAVLVYYFFKLKISLKSVISGINCSKFKSLFSRFKHFPLYSTPTSLVDHLNAALPIFLLGYFYSDDVVGQYSLSFKVSYVPVIFISISLAESIKKKISVFIRENRSYKKIVIKWLKILFPISGVIFLLFYTLSEIGFPIIFGEKWAYAGTLTKMLAIMFFFRILVNPFGFIYLVSENQKILFLIQLSTLIISALALYLGYYLHDDPTSSILFYSVAYSMKYIVEAIGIFKISP